MSREGDIEVGPVGLPVRVHVAELALTWRMENARVAVRVGGGFGGHQTFVKNPSIAAKL
jgi:hypothetical protein